MYPSRRKNFKKNILEGTGFPLKIIPFSFEEKNCVYVFFYYFGEGFLEILSWGWNVYFFSSSTKKRNEDVIPKFLKDFFNRYSDECEKVYDLFVKGGTV